jgi:serine protease Do
MKKLVVAAFTLLSLSALAQEDKQVIIEERIDGQKSSKKQRQEIVIRSKGDKDKKITVEINGDKVSINGKPLIEFKDDDITINKRNVTIFDGKNKMMFEPNDMEVYFERPLKERVASINYSSPAFLGVTTAVINEDKNDTKPNGAAITTINKGSAAEKAGLKEGDIITKINETKISSPSDLTEAIAEKKPKDEVTVTYKREGKENTTKAILGKRAETMTTLTFRGPKGDPRSFSMPRLENKSMELNRGMEGLEELKALEGFDMNGFGQMDNFDFAFGNRKKIGLKIQDVEEGTGVKILSTDEDSPAEKAGLKKDDIITEINGKAVNNTDEARELLKPEENKNKYTIKAKRNGTAMSFDVKIPKKLKTADL